MRLAGLDSVEATWEVAIWVAILVAMGAMKAVAAAVATMTEVAVKTAVATTVVMGAVTAVLCEGTVQCRLIEQCIKLVYELSAALNVARDVHEQTST